MENAIIGQVLGIIATVLTAISYQANTKRSLLVIQSGATLFTAVSYLFLGAGPGFFLNIVCLIRNVTFYFVKERTRLSFVLSAILAAAMCALGALSWMGPVSLLIIIALALNTVFMSFGDPQFLRKSILLTSSMIFIYNVAYFSIGGMMNEGISIVSSVIGIIRFSKATGCEHKSGEKE